MDGTEAAGDEEAQRRRRDRTTVRITAAAWLLTLVFMVAITALAAAYDVPVKFLTREPAWALKQEQSFDRFYAAGLASNVGVLIWWTAVPACLLAWLVRTPGDRRSPLLAGGLFTAVLAADDLLMVHEVWAPEYGIPEELVLAVYGAALLAFVLTQRRFLRGMTGALFVASCGWFALSLGIDQLHIDTEGPFEDGAKLFGIVTWTVLFVRASFLTLADGGSLDAPRSAPTRLAR
jgi:hypothetical protein